MKRVKWIFCWAILMAIMIFGSFQGAAYAQSSATTGTVSGFLADDQGGRIGGVAVKITRLSTNEVREVTSGEDGTYTITNLQPGDYEIEIAAEGFKTQKARLNLPLGTNVTIDSILQLGKVEENIVEVKANTSLDKTKTENSVNVDTGRIDNLPINQRNFLDFSLTVPRVVVDRRPAQGTTGSSGISFNSQSARFNNITIDGLDNNDTNTGSVLQTFSQDAVQEFQVVTDNYSAEFGRAIGGNINIVTRSGGNDLHGTIFFFNRNDAISAREPFASFKPEFKQYQFGATLSGPIKKDKTFFFNSFERLSLKQNNIVTIDDATVASANRLGFPVSNGPQPAAVDTTALLFRVDHQLSPLDKLNIRYNYAGTYNGQFEPFGGNIDSTASTRLNVNNNALALTNTYISPGLNLVNETRFLVNRLNSVALKLAPGNITPQVQLIQPVGSFLFGPPQSTPQLRKEYLTQISDIVSLGRGRHQMKFGFDFLYRRRSQGSQDQLFATGFSLFVPFDFRVIAPNFPVFTSLQSLDPSIRTPAQIGVLQIFSAVLPSMVPGFPSGVPIDKLPIPAVFIQGFGDARLDPPLTSKNFSAFFQDDIKVTDKLLVKLGLRYDINRIRYQPSDNGNISPRVSIAYSPRKNLVLRAGGGLYYGGQLTGLAFVTELSRRGQAQIYQVPFPLSIIPFAQPNHRFEDSSSVPAFFAALPPQLKINFKFQDDYHTSYTGQATAGVDYGLDDSTTVSAIYTYVRGVRLIQERNVNPIVRPIPNDPGLLQSSIVGRLDPSKGLVIEEGTFGDSYYHALTLLFNRRLSRNFSLLGSYTFGKAIDNVIEFRADIQDGPEQTLRFDQERALSTQDVRHRAVFSGLWNLDYTKNPFLKDFQISSIVSLESGRTYNLLAGIDLGLEGNAGAPSSRPRINGTPIPRNAGVTPGFATVDMRITRFVVVKERFRIQASLEAFNLFNRVNISSVNRVFPPDFMGNFNLPPRTGDNNRFIATKENFLGAFPPRRLQFSFRFTF